MSSSDRQRLAPINISSIPEALLESSVETEWRESGESQIEVMLAIYNYWKVNTVLAKSSIILASYERN